MKPLHFRSLGLWLSGVRAEVQQVKKAHRKPCYVCEKTPKDRRLAIQTGAGRSHFAQVLCSVCGSMWIEMTLREGRRALEALQGTLGHEPIRLGWSSHHKRSLWLKTKLRPKPKPKNDR